MRLRIRELREDNDIKQSEMAEYLNVSRATYTRYETGEIKPSVDVLYDIADYFGTSIDYLVGRTDTKDKDGVARRKDFVVKAKTR